MTLQTDLLRPFDLRLVSQGDEVCDTRGRKLTLDGATEMIAQNGTDAVRMLPEMWLNNKPVYWDSIVRCMERAAPWDYESIVALGWTPIAWPEPKSQQVVEVYVDGQLAGADLIPSNAVLQFWDLHYSIKE